MAKRFFKIILIIFLFSSLKAYSKEDFTPWGADVLAGDRLLLGEQKKFFNKEIKIDNGIERGASFFILFFQKVISPQDGPSCHFKPVCSAYGKMALIKHGAFWGTLLAGERILRCNPYTLPAFDPVLDSIFE